MNIIERILDKLLKKREIVNCEHDVYLDRWFLWRGKRVGIYIHRFRRSDEDRCLHDHPWSFIVIPLWRGYIEHSETILPMWEETFPNSRRVYPILGTRYRPAEYRHRVELISCPKHGTFNKANQKYEAPAWSLFIRFKKRREWGFWTIKGVGAIKVFVAWNKFWKDNKCD